MYVCLISLFLKYSHSEGVLKKCLEKHSTGLKLMTEYEIQASSSESIDDVKAD